MCGRLMALRCCGPNDTPRLSGLRTWSSKTDRPCALHPRPPKPARRRPRAGTLCGSTDHPEPQVGGVRRLDQHGALELVLATQVLEEPCAAAEQDRGQMDLDLVQQAGSNALL